MLALVSLSEYSIAISIAVVLYYVIIGITYFKNEIINFSFKKKKPHIYQTELFPSPKKYASSIEKSDDTFHQVEELTAKLKKAIEYAASNNTIREEFVLSLQLIIKKYHFLKDSPFLIAINNLIASECDKHNFIRLTADEMVMLWN